MLRESLASRSFSIDEIVGMRYSPGEIESKTSRIHEAAVLKCENIRSANFARISTVDVRYIFRLYDRFFFGDFFTLGYRQRLTFYLSNAMTRAGGKLRWSLRGGESYFKMGLAVGMLFDNFRSAGDERKIGGIVCMDRLQALQRVVEHETIHLVEVVRYGESNCSKGRFKSICKSIFGHTESVHGLDTPRVIARELGFHVGDWVGFSIKGRHYTGVVVRIGHRATVSVRGVDGRRVGPEMAHAKAYVALNHLKKLD